MTQCGNLIIFWYFLKVFSCKDNQQEKNFESKLTETDFLESETVTVDQKEKAKNSDLPFTDGYDAAMEFKHSARLVHLLVTKFWLQTS